MTKKTVPLTPMETAVAFLRDFFAAHPQGAWVTEIVQAAEAAGIGERTLRRAAHEVGVVRFPAGPAGAIWRPARATERA